HMSNDLIAIDLIPNRGRILSNFMLTDKQQSYLYQKFVPDPMVLPGGLHTVEFGGYYFSLPWNTRDRQPFDLQFEILNSTDDLGEIFLSGKDNETLVARTKESYDGAMPSGNSVMAYVLSRLALLTDDEEFARRAERQSAFMNGLAASYPAGYGFYLYGALPVKKIVCATNDPAGLRGLRVRSDWAFRFASGPEYPIIDNKTTYYVCEGGVCHPPAHAI
ncbi:MAG TPA: hypothetical protein PK438_07150, partial [Clostridia bacterium]|nr:hypothetical protein [Clostridia bacterium]